MRDKGAATAVATLLAAFATAHLMQFGLSAGRAVTGEAQGAPIGVATLIAWGAGSAPSDLPATPSPLSDPAVAALEPPAARPTPRDAAVPPALGAAAESGFGVPCARTLTLRPLPGALIAARVEAPCDPGVRIELSHAGLRFALATNAGGRAEAHVPALMTEAEVEAAFADGTRLFARSEVPDAARMERVALVAEGWTGVTLHASRDGRRGERADLGAEARDTAVLLLGDPGIEAPLLAQIYTAPAGRLGSLGAASLRIETALSPANCARDVDATVVRSTGGVPPSPVALRLSLPACDAEGGVLVVGLPSPGLRLARN